MKRINEILEQEDEFSAPIAEGIARNPSESIEFRDISAGYDGTPIIKDISISIPAGKLIGIIGPTGSGKTTFIKLLLRFLEPQTGSVLFDGIDIRTMNPYEYRSLFGYVSQDGFLFSATIRENIAFGLDHAAEADQEIRNAIRVSALERDLALFPEAEQTQIGERGITISGGQKQRVTIARALVKKPDILVIDDALSALDAHTEEEILTQILDVRRGRTTFLVSHRVSALSHADMTMVFDGGKIQSIGPHEELVRKSGFYRDIYLLQQSENREAQ